jgi:Ni/Co efflux regulator RcnB
MRKTILTALIMATALPGMAPAAMAQTHELRRDRQDIREERRELRDARAYGDRRDVREERRDVRNARQEYREDWRDYRSKNRDLYRRGNWRAPFAYQRFDSGVRLRPVYYSSSYRIPNPHRYRLYGGTGAYTWIRHYDDAILVNTRTGRVAQVHRGFFW